ncbi:hypothetical protein NOF04DRAFT_1325330 [Fusarium oxysporum II5]|nr:hypothetical protein DER44DRAFT_495252 [Fusarium oxysporum]KAK2128156.1 hypothetical protein NOF04DRAFT_1325330 [Fusarium oxysporum II5]
MAIELLPGLVKVRTVDGSLSHSEAVIIAGIVRMGRRGFIDDPRRVAVLNCPLSSSAEKDLFKKKPVSATLRPHKAFS